MIAYLLTLLVLLITLPAHAAHAQAPDPPLFDGGSGTLNEHFVSPTGTGSTCSVGTPCSLNTGLAAAVAGESVVLLDGTYAQQLETVRDGATNAHIIIRAQNTGKAKIKAAIAKPVWIRHSHITIRGLFVDDEKTSGLGDGSIRIDRDGGNDHIIIEDCTVFQAGNTGIIMTGQDFQDHHIIIRNNLINGAGYNIEGVGEAIYVSRTTIGAPGVENVVISGNEIRDFSSNGIDVKASANKVWVFDNEFHSQVPFTAHGFSQAEEDSHSRDGTILVQGSEVYVFNNIIHDNDARSQVFKVRKNLAGRSPNLIYNNVIFDITNISKAILFLDSANDGEATSIFNNTFFNLTAHTVDGTPTEVIVKNNIGIDGVADNLTASEVTGSYFKSLANENFDLTSEATGAIDKATSEPTSPTDFSGQVVFNGIRDYGAFEFNGTMAISYGTNLEACHAETTQQPGTNGILIAPDDGSPQFLMANNTNKTIYIRAGTYENANFITNDGNVILPSDCDAVTLKPTADNTNIQTNDDWTFAGLRFDCSAGTGNCFRIDGPVTGFTVRNNFFDDASSGLTVRADGAKQGVIQGNRFRSIGGATRIRGLVQFKDDMGDVVFKENWIDIDPTNTSNDGNDAMTVQGVSSPGLVVTDNLFTGQTSIEQYIDVKRSEPNGVVEISHNTFVGPSTGHGNGDGERAMAMTLGDNTNAQLAKGTNPTHSIHHNYFKDSWTQDETTNGTVGAWAMRIGTNRFFSGVLEFNIEDNAQNGNIWEVQNEVFDRVTYRHNSHFMGAVRYQNEACDNDAAFTMDNNVFHQTRIDDNCAPANDWTVTNNVFSQVLDSGIDAGNQGAGNSDATIAYGSTDDANPDFTVLGGTHSQKGALPAPVIASAAIAGDCVLKVTITPYNDLYDHGPLSQADGTKVTPHYSGSADPTVTNTSLNGNIAEFALSSCPLSTDTVTFDATHGWCQDSANVGSTFAELADDVTLPAVMRARCLATTGEAVTNNVAGGGPSTFFVDVACGVDGDGTTATCGANGPWNTLESALVTDACAGMVAGDTLEIKGGTYQETESLVPDAACSGITIENASGEDVVLDGTVDISGETWNAIGGNVFETTYDFGADEFPFTAWYDVGAGELRLDLIQSNQTCDATLAAGKMRYDPATNRVCAHLADDSSPADADNFLIPQKDAAIRFQGDTANHVTLRENPGGGSFTVQRFAERGITLHHDKNGHITIDGLDVGWMYDICLSATSGPQQSAFTVINSTIHHCGNVGIRSEGDTGNDGNFTGNTITDIQTEPIFEQCSGVGDGCLGTLWDDGAGIRLLNRNGIAKSIANNTILRVGGGNTGRAYGIWLRKWNNNVTVDSNYIAHISGLADTGYGIVLTGDSAQELQKDIVVKNNRVVDTDVAYAHVYEGGFTTEAGEAVSIFNNSFVNFLEAGIQLELADTAADGAPISVRNNIIASYSGTPLHINIPINNSEGWGDFKNNDVYCDACTTGDVFIAYKGAQVSQGTGGSCTPSLPAPSLTQLFDFDDWTINNGTGLTDNRPTDMVLSGSSWSIGSPVVSKPASNLLLVEIILTADTPGEDPHGLRIGTNQNDPGPGNHQGGTDFTYDPDASSTFNFLYTYNANSTTANFTILEASKVSNTGNDIKITDINIYSFDDASELPGLYTTKTPFTLGRLTTDADSRTYLDGDPFIIKMLYCDQVRDSWSIYPPMGWNMCGRVISVNQAVKAASAGMYFMYQLSSFVGNAFGFDADTLSDADKLQGIMDSTQTFTDPKTGQQRPLRDFMIGFYLDNEWGERWDTTPGFLDVIPAARAIAPNRLVYILNGNQGRALGLAAEGLQDYTGVYVGAYFPHDTVRLGLHAQHASPTVTSGVGVAQLNSLGNLDSEQLDFTGNFGGVSRGVNFFRDSPGAQANGSTDLVTTMTQADTDKLLAFETAALAEYEECEDEWAGPEISGNIFTDPAVSTTGDDPTLAISSGSNAEDAGLTLAAVTVDYEDDSRPQGAAYDIGADEAVGAGAAFTFEQKSYRFYGRFMAEGLQPLAAEDTDVELYNSLSLRFSVVARSGNANETGFKLFARLCDPSCGAWTAVDQASDAAVGVYIIDNPARMSRKVNTNQLALDSDTYNEDGVYVDADTDPVNAELLEDEQVELEWSLAISSGASAGNTIELRVEESDGTDLDTYTVTPTINVISARQEASGGLFTD